MALPSIVRCPWRALGVILLACTPVTLLPLGRASAEDPQVLAQAPGGAPATAPKPAAPKPTEQKAADQKPVEPEAGATTSAAAPEVPSGDEPAPDAPVADANMTDFEAPEATLSSKAATAGARANLEKRLRELEAERESTSNLLPWITVITGAAMVLVSSAVGAVNAFDCEPNTKCIAPPWASLGVVAGGAIGAAGALWLVRTDADIRELEHQKGQLQLDLEQLDHAKNKHSRLARRGGPGVSIRLAF